VEELIEDMSMGLDNVTTAYITTATRDTVMDGITVREGAYIGLADKTILSCDDDKTVAAETLLSNIPHLDEKEVVIVFSGKDATDDEVRALQNSIAAHLPDAEVAVIDGGQDVYDFIISLE
jgi:dihydroxyacetone kinase-like predicted kinase